jgi:hypothetical protein
VSGRKITVNNGFQTSDFAAGSRVSFSIGGVLNPVSTSTTSSFTFTTFDSSDFQINVRSSGITVTMTSVTDLERVTLGMGSTTNGATNTYTFEITASSPLVDGDRIYIKVPTSITPPTTPTCVGITLLATSLTCNTLNREIFITVSAASGTTIDASNEFSFSISNFINPSSTKESLAFTFEAQDSTGSLINTYTSTLTVTATTDTAATITTASVSNENKLASQSTTMNLNFTTIHQIPLNGIIILTYPSQVAPFDASVAAVTCSLNIATGPVCTHYSANRTIEISNILTTTFLAAGTEIEITLNEMKNPSLATATNSFRIATYQVDGSNFIIDQITSGLTISVTCDFPCRV